jgi:hypothetical protein
MKIESRWQSISVGSVGRYTKRTPNYYCTQELLLTGFFYDASVLNHDSSTYTIGFWKKQCGVSCYCLGVNEAGNEATLGDSAF